MRTKEELMKEAVSRIDVDISDIAKLGYNESLFLEVLIDIRDQLAKFYETGITTMSVS